MPFSGHFHRQLQQTWTKTPGLQAGAREQIFSFKTSNKEYVFFLLNMINYFQAIKIAVFYKKNKFEMCMPILNRFLDL